MTAIDSLYRKCEHGFHHPPWPHSCDGCFGCEVPPEYRRTGEFAVITDRVVCESDDADLIGWSGW